VTVDAKDGEVVLTVTAPRTGARSA
jgi:hypothetical protein